MIHNGSAAISCTSTVSANGMPIHHGSAAITCTATVVGIGPTPYFGAFPPSLRRIFSDDFRTDETFRTFRKLPF